MTQLSQSPHRFAGLLGYGRTGLARCVAFCSLLMIGLAAAGAAMLEQGGGYDLSWHTIDGGGGTSEGGGFSLSGTIGQPDAGTMSGGDFTLVGGFWAGGAAADPGPTCTGDLNGDGVVNVSDLLILFDSWGSCPGCPADFNGDGVVNVSDLLILFDNWGACP
jgi:hypothetical protein